MMHDFDDDLVGRSLAMPGDEADEGQAAQRKARLMASIARLDADPSEQARIVTIAVRAGIARQADDAPPGTPEDALPQDRPDDLGRVAASIPRSRSLPPSRRTGEKQKAPRRLSDYLAWLGGADRTLLDQVPQERARFTQMAGVLLTTAGIAMISMIFALHDGVHVSLLPSVVLSLLWGIVILNLDRFLVISIGSTRARWRLVLMTLPRLALALVLALVISTPLVLRIFASDINAQLYNMQLQASRQQVVELAQSADGQEASRLQTQISENQAILAGHLSQTITSPQLQSAQAQVTKLQNQANTDYRKENAAREVWQCQLYGQACAGGSGVAGNGPIAHADHQAYLQAVNAYNSTKNQLNKAVAAQETAQAGLAKNEQARVKEIQAEARTALPQLQSKYQALEKNLQSESADDVRAIKANTGLLAQLQALSQVSAHSPSLEAARLAVLALFLVIEMLPVTVKFLLNLCPPSAYERLAAVEDDEVVSSAIARRNEYRHIQEMTSETKLHLLDLTLQEWVDEISTRSASGERQEPSAS